MPSIRPLYGGCPYLGGSVMGGSTVLKSRLDTKVYSYRLYLCVPYIIMKLILCVPKC